MNNTPAATPRPAITAATAHGDMTRRLPDTLWSLDGQQTAAIRKAPQSPRHVPTGYRAVIDRGVVTVEIGGQWSTRADALDALADHCAARATELTGSAATEAIAWGVSARRQADGWRMREVA